MRHHRFSIDTAVDVGRRHDPKHDFRSVRIEILNDTLAAKGLADVRGRIFESALTKLRFNAVAKPLRSHPLPDTRSC